MAGWLRRLWWRVQDKLDPPCSHPIEHRRPALRPDLGAAWTCRQCGNTVRCSRAEMDAVLMTMRALGER